MTGQLPIYPTGTAFMSLDDLVLPGGFNDRIGIAEAIDREQVSEHDPFLHQLGAKTLTQRTYLTESVPAAARRTRNCSPPAVAATDRGTRRPA